MKKTFKVVMLPTEKASSLHQSNVTYQTHDGDPPQIKGQLAQTERECVLSNYDNIHLYIISDDEIKEGDWFIEFLNGKPLNVRHLDVTPVKGTILKDDKKIIATTDTLTKPIQIRIGESIEMLPQLPESFIQAYIKAYNEGKPITEVDLKMNDDGFCERLRTGECKTACDNGFCKESSIKTRLDNTVIVHQSKMYTRAEVAELCLRAYILGGIEEHKDEVTIDDWINENL